MQQVFEATAPKDVVGKELKGLSSPRDVESSCRLAGGFIPLLSSVASSGRTEYGGLILFGLKSAFDTKSMMGPDSGQGEMFGCRRT